MKTRLLSLFLIGFVANAMAQNVGIGNTSFTPDASSILELRTTSGGFLMPRMTEAQRDAISSPASGLMIYQTNNTAGYYYFDGSSWVSFGASIDNLGDHTATQNLVVGPSLGLTDTDEDTKIYLEKLTDEDNVRIDVAGAEAMIVANDRNVGIGTSNPTHKLHVDGNIRVGENGYIDDDGTLAGNNDDWLRLNGYIEMKSNSDNYGLVIRDKDNTQYFGLTQKNGWSYLSDNAASGSYFLRGSGSNVEVRGDMIVRGSDLYDNSGNMRISGEDNVHITMDYNNNDNNNRSIIFGKNNMSSPTELMRLTEVGNLGIGTASPANRLHVSGKTQTDQLQVSSGATNGYVLTSDASGNATWQPVAADVIDNDGDTQIQVEESADEDRIRFDVAGNQAMIIDNTGNVGIGTSTPDRQLNIGRSTGAQILLTREDNSTQIGNTLGEIIFDSTDDTTPSTNDGSAMIRATASENHGNSNKGGNLHFYTKGTGNGSGNPARERMVIEHTGDVGIGLSNPSYRFHVTQSTTGGGDNVIEFINTSNNGLVHFNDNLATNNSYHAMESWTNKNNNGGGTPFGVFGGSYSSSNGSNGGGVYGHVNSRRGIGVLGVRGNTSGGQGFAGLFQGKLGYTGGLANLSDKRLKRDIENLEGALEIVESLRATTYYFDTEMNPHFGLSETKQFGFIAQEIEEVIPEIVLDAELPELAREMTKKESMENVEMKTYKSYDFPQLIPILTKAIQEQQDIIEQMEAKNNALEARLEAIEAKLK